MAGLRAGDSTELRRAVYFWKRASPSSIFSRSMRYCLELRTSSSLMTISWCYFSLPLKRLSCTYFLPWLFMGLLGRAECGYSLPFWEGLSDRVFSETECFFCWLMCLRLLLSASLITNFIILSHILSKPTYPKQASHSHNLHCSLFNQGNFTRMNVVMSKWVNRGGIICRFCAGRPG